MSSPRCELGWSPFKLKNKQTKHIYSNWGQNMAELFQYIKEQVQHFGQ